MTSKNGAVKVKGGNGKAAEPKAEGTPKVKAERYPIAQLTIIGAWKRTYSTGKVGFFGSAIDPATGKRFQLIGAVEIAS